MDDTLKQMSQAIEYMYRTRGPAWLKDVELLADRQAMNALLDELPLRIRRSPSDILTPMTIATEFGSFTLRVSSDVPENEIHFKHQRYGFGAGDPPVAILRLGG